ncbi:MAG: hypothetical protein OXG49_03180 [Chloroflexi bacterium]|nr:hypothetical protein [Chloroflexota bacterium]
MFDSEEDKFLDEYFDELFRSGGELTSSIRRWGTTRSDLESFQTLLLEQRDFFYSDPLLKEFVRSWRSGNPLPGKRHNDQIHEYCWLTFNYVHPQQALQELHSIQRHYGDGGTDLQRPNRIQSLIAGCYAALGQFDEAKEELRSTAHESFGLTRRYTDFCLAFGFYEDLIEFLRANVSGERHLRGGYATAQLIMAYSLLGRTDDAIPYLKARVNVRVRDQQLIDNIWSLKLPTGERPEGREVLTVQRSKLRTFGKKNMEMVADTIDVLLEVFVRETGESLLQRWSKECNSSKYVCNLHLISIPGVLNPSKALQFVKERNSRYYIEVDVIRYSFIDNQSVKAFLADVTRLAEDLTKAAGRAVSVAEINDSELTSLLKIDVIRRPESFDLEAVVPAKFHVPALVIDTKYKPSRKRLARYDALGGLIQESYARRDIDPTVIDETIKLCEEQIILSYHRAQYEHRMWRIEVARRKRNSARYAHDPKYQKLYLEQVSEFKLRTCIAFERLAIILENRHEYERALRCVVKAKTEGWPGKWDKRIARLVKKLGK